MSEDASREYSLSDLRVVDVAAEDELFYSNKVYRQVYRVQASPVEDSVAVACSGRKVDVYNWSILPPRHLVMYRPKCSVHCLRYCPDGTKLVGWGN
jgi:hypothetical protein